MSRRLRVEDRKGSANTHLDISGGLKLLLTITAIVALHMIKTETNFLSEIGFVCFI